MTHSSGGRSHTRFFATEPADKLGARLHVELAEHLSEVVFDGARTDEELCGDVSIRVSVRREARDLSLLRR